MTDAILGVIFFAFLAGLIWVIANVGMFLRRIFRKGSGVDH